MRVTSPLSDQQLAVLRWIGDGCPAEVMTGHGHKHTARALADRRLVEISRRGGGWQATLREAGRYYLDRGHHPDIASQGKTESDRAVRTTGQSTAPARAREGATATSASLESVPRRQQPSRANIGGGFGHRQSEAELLLTRLTNEHRVRIPDATDEEIRHWRAIVDVARRQNLVPDDMHVTTRKMYGGSFEIRLAAGLHPNSRPAQPPADLPSISVPERLGRPHPVIAEIRDDPGRLVLPQQPELRRRALRILQGLVAEALRRGHQVKPCPVPEQHHRRYYWGSRGKDDPLYTRHEAQLRILIDGFPYTVDIRRESPASSDPDKATLLKLELPGRQVARSTWADRKRTSLEDVLSAVLHELEQRAVADRQAAIEAEQARAERKVRWEAAMEHARTGSPRTHEVSPAGDLRAPGIGTRGSSTVDLLSMSLSMKLRRL